MSKLGQFAASRTFDPNSLSNKVARYRAADIAGKNDGDSLTVWADAWGGHHMTAGATAPIFKKGIVNGNPVVRFISTSNGYGCSAFAVPGNQASVAFVFNVSSVAQYGQFIEISANYNSNAFAFISYYNTNSTAVFASNDAGGNFHSWTSTSPTNVVKTSTWMLFMGTTDSSLVAGNRTQGYLFSNNGGGYVDGTYWTNNWGNFQMFLGARNQGTNGGGIFVGDFAEAIICSNVWSAQDQENIRNYARQQYGVIN